MPIPQQVLAAAVGSAEAELLGCTSQALAGGSGAATASITRLTGTAWCGDSERRFSLVRKAFAPGDTDQRHWAYWRREPLAYAEEILPQGPGLRAPRCYGVDGDVVYLEDIVGDVEDPRVAAFRLGAWQASVSLPDLSWLADDELQQRVGARPLDWSTVDADPRLAAIWEHRQELLAERQRSPLVLSHGDFHLGNIIGTGNATVVLDWGNLGQAPLGADLAHLSLSALVDLVDDYLAGAAGRVSEAAVRRAYRGTLLLVGTSRAHWWLSRGMALPAGHVDFVLSYR